jgi:hypothetical protein
MEAISVTSIPDSGKELLLNEDIVVNQRQVPVLTHHHFNNGLWYRMYDEG